MPLSTAQAQVMTALKHLTAPAEVVEGDYAMTDAEVRVHDLTTLAPKLSLSLGAATNFVQSLVNQGLLHRLPQFFNSVGWALTPAGFSWMQIARASQPLSADTILGKLERSQFPWRTLDIQNGCLKLVGQAMAATADGGATFTVTDPPPQLAPFGISTGSLPTPSLGQHYSAQLFVIDALGSAAFTATFSISSGQLPPGLALDWLGGLAGTPSQAGSYTFTVFALDATGEAASHAYTLVVS